LIYLDIRAKMRLNILEIHRGLMDEIDRLILQALQEDGRTPFTQIAKKAGVSETTIRSRYRNLVEEGVVHTVSIVDPFAMDFQAPAMIGIKTESGKIEEVAKAIAELPEVSYVVLTLGSYDLLVEVYCRNLHHLTHLVTRVIQMIPGVWSTETLMVARIYKLSYRWSPVNHIEDLD
jgi:Lrp/AsnC family transcriptional regulator, regulator for asnA, asnC and gidA